MGPWRLGRPDNGGSGAARIAWALTPVADGWRHPGDSPQETERARPGYDLHDEHEDALIAIPNRVIRGAVRVLAVLMVMVIVWGIGVMEPPVLLMQISDILATFGAVLAVLIAIEISPTSPCISAPMSFLSGW